MRQRDTHDKAGSKAASGSPPQPSIAPTTSSSSYTSPSTLIKGLRIPAIAALFLPIATCMHIQQFLGAPLYWIRRDWYYSWQSFVKQSGALTILAINQWFAPAKARLSGDASVQGQIRASNDNGKLVLDFPDRVVLMSNHQIYTDWIFMWWIAYINGRHGDLFIILKESIKSIPIIGPGLMFFSFIFLSRKWENDKAKLSHRMAHLSQARTPMWLLIFPEGTNMSTNAYAASKKWEQRASLPQRELVLHPRTRGLQLCVEELANSVEWLYDCTLAYDGIPPGEYGQEVFSLKRLYIEGRQAPLIHLHWRRYAIKDIPFRNEDDFTKWLNARWAEKEDLMLYQQRNGEFPAHDGHIATYVRLTSTFELAQLLLAVMAVTVVWWTGVSVIGSIKAYVNS